MAETAERLIRFSRLATPEADRMLRESPSLLDRVVSALESGVDLPLMIKPEDIERCGLDDNIIKRKEGSPPPARKEAIRLPERKNEKVKPEDMAPISDSISNLMKRRRETELDTPGLKSGSRALAREFDADLRIVRDPSSSMGSQGKIEDFRKLFLSRYRKLRSILLEQHGDLSPVENISDLRGSEEAARFVGIVDSARTTKNGHIMLELEDPTGRIKVLISKNRRELQSIKVVEDEVIGITGKFRSGSGRGGSIVFADSILKVDVPSHHRRRISPDKGLLAAFTSDIHIGSRMFLEKEWKRMIRWFKGEEAASLKAEDGLRVKYLVVAGDLVDGIGIYPDQDRDLIHKDITKQYEALAESLSLVPDHIEIILIPGNHDAVRLAEPQPPLPEEFRELFTNPGIHFLSNPTTFDISGVRVAAYHGKSIDDMVTLFKDVTYERPIQGMKEMLRSRHFGPTYGMRNQLAPEEDDMLVIEDVPDIFVSGHVHRFEMDTYKGIQLIEGSTWQSQTPFQKMMNLKPQPAKMGVVELSLPNTMYAWEIT